MSPFRLSGVVDRSTFVGGDASDGLWVVDVSVWNFTFPFVVRRVINDVGNRFFECGGTFKAVGG